jgi:uncharacterized protein
MDSIALPTRQDPASRRKFSGRVAPDSRLVEVDMVRGFALFGVLLVNMYGYGADSIAWNSPADRLAYSTMHIFFESKSWTLFSLLFGFGFALQLERARARGLRAIPAYLRRLAVLFALGAAHALLYDGDILMLYAELGLGLLFVRRLPTRTLVLLAAALLLVFPLAHFAAREHQAGPHDPEAARAELAQAQQSHVYAVGTLAEVAADNAIYIPANPVEDPSAPESGLAVFAMLLLGLCVGRSGLLHDIPGNAAAIARVRAWGLGLGLGAMAVEQILSATAGYEAFRAPHAAPAVQLAGDLLFVAGTTALALGYAAALMLAAQSPRGRAILAPLAAVGRLALTVYLLQTLIFTTLFHGYGFAQAFRLGPAAVTGWAVAFFTVQVVACRWWSRRFRFGPLEWLWRSVAYLEWQPLRLVRPSTP